jgi:hypothetical protein
MAPVQLGRVTYSTASMLLPSSQVTFTALKNQKPTKKLTKGRVLHKRLTSSLAKFDHSCVPDELLEMVKGDLKL